MSFLNIFGKSPIKPMQEHMTKIFACVSCLDEFFDAAYGDQWDQAKHCLDRIVQIEHEADELKKYIRCHLPSSLFMPVSRADLLGLLTAQDKIASKAKHIVSIIYTRKVDFPELLRSDLQVLVRKCIETTKQAKKAVDRLHELVETGFRGKEVNYVSELIEILESLERETDILQVTLRNDLHSIENSLNPIEVIFLYKIIDWAGDLADRAHSVGYRLETLLAH